MTMTGTMTGAMTVLRTANKHTIELTEGALCVALSVVLSYFEVFAMPQGGSISAEMAPLLFFAYRRGVKLGCLAGAITGGLMLVLRGYVVHPVQALLDYPLAYSCIGLAGVSRELRILPSLAAFAGRLFCHTTAGVFFFSDYAPGATGLWAYSFIYNLTIVGPTAIVSMILAIIAENRLRNRNI